MNEFYYYILDLLQGTYTLRILMSFFELFFEIVPYVIVSIFIQVVLLQIVKRKGVFFKIKNQALSILLGTVMGMVSPLPTYAALPIGISLIPLGLPFSAVIAFIIASPLINPGVFFLTITQLGNEIAFARLITTFIISSGGGFIAAYLFKNFTLPKTHIEIKNNLRPFWYEFWRSTLFIGKYFVISILISAAVKALLSPQFVTQILGKHIQRSLLIAIALGVPFYSCGGAAIPFIQVLSDMGMNKGAVLSFFIAGPATKFETMYVFKSILGVKILVFYLMITIIGAYISGVLFVLI